jgi:hypothetical protein
MPRSQTFAPRFKYLVRAYAVSFHAQPRATKGFEFLMKADAANAVRLKPIDTFQAIANWAPVSATVPFFACSASVVGDSHTCQKTKHRKTTRNQICLMVAYILRQLVDVGPIRRAVKGFSAWGLTPQNTSWRINHGTTGRENFTLQAGQTHSVWVQYPDTWQSAYGLGGVPEGGVGNPIWCTPS